MTKPRDHFFSLHELLMMAALAALGGVTGSALSNIRAAVHAILPSPIGMQPLAGIHVLWPVLAVGLVRKPGAATVTGLLAGPVEFLSANPHGLLVVLYCLVAGITVDVVWLLLGARHHLAVYMLAGGMGAASNVVVLTATASLPSQGAVITMVALLASVAFVSGVFFAGLLGWWLLRTLRVAGVIGAYSKNSMLSGHSPARPRFAVLGAVIILAGSAVYLVLARPDSKATAGPDQADGSPTDVTVLR